MKKQLLFYSLAIFGGSFSFGQQVATTIVKQRTIQNFNETNKSFQANNLNAQKSNTVIWGAGAPVGAADGEFQNAFVQDNSTTFGGENPSAWTAKTEFESSGSVVPGDAYWVRSTTGLSVGGYATGMSPISSPSAANGCALFDSDFLDNGGDPNGIGSGISPAKHRGSLISPRIDLTGYTDSVLAVNFHSYYRNYDITELSVSISTDDGLSYTTVDYRSFQPAGGEDYLSILIPNVTDGVANLSQCRIKFTFDGDYYYAMVDDVSLVVAAEKDLTIAVVDPQGTGLGDEFEIFQITSNAHFPLSQLTSSHLLFGANVKNYGYEDVMPVDSAMLNLIIQMEQGANNWVTVYTQDILLDTIPADNIGKTFADSLASTSWLSEGKFRGIYVTSLGSDKNAANDSLIHYFSLNGNDYASKVEIGQHNKPLSTNVIFPGGTSFNKFEYGSMFDFTDAVNNNLVIDSVDFIYYVPSDYDVNNAPNSYNLFVNIYRFNDSNNSEILDDENELSLVGTSLVTIDDLHNKLSSFNVATATNLVDPITGGPFSFLSNEIYLVTVMIDPTIFGGGPFTANTSVWFGASREKNYAMNAAYSLHHVSPVLVKDNANNGSWNWIGFGADVVPSIGVHLSGGCTPINSTDTQVACDSYDWIDGNTYTSNNNTATHTISNGAANGCDSIVTLNLTINTVNVNVTDNSPTLTADATGAGYQWLDCDNGNSIINGETNQSFSAQANGNYAVEVTENGCVDTSSCVSVIGIGVQELEMFAVNVVPNPTKGIVKLIFENDQFNSSEIMVLDVVGKIIHVSQITSNTETLDLSNQEAGVYFIRITTDDNVKLVKLIKQ